MNVVKQIQKQNERKSLVKELVALRPIVPIVITESHPLQVCYSDQNPPPQPVDQFAPYLSRKLTLKRTAKVKKLKGDQPRPQTSFILSQRTENCRAVSARKPEPVPLQEPDPPESNARISKDLQEHLKMEQTFDKIATGSTSTALHRLIESTLQIFFLSDKVLFYHDISSIQILYCPTTTGSCPHGSGLVGYTQYSRVYHIYPKACAENVYSPQFDGNSCPPDSHVLLFPIFDVNSNVKGVVEVIRSSNSPLFEESDISFVTYFQTKCKMYSRWLFQPVLDDSFASNIIQTTRIRQFVEITSEKLQRLFSCKFAEIWSLNRTTNCVFRYSSKSDFPIEVKQGESGIAGFSLRQQIPISCISARIHSAYSEATDGDGDLSVLSIPCKDPDSPNVYTIVLRGKRIPQFFTENDEKILAKITPYVIISLNSSMIAEQNHHTLEESIEQQGRLKSLLEVAEILSGELQMSVLIPKIMKRACELVKADRCSLFMVDETHTKLSSYFTGGMTKAIEIPIDKGVVGWTATKGEVLNIKDAYLDSRFSRATDLSTGYRTLTILSVPIYDHQKGIYGVTEMINKLDGVFSPEDEKMIQIFNVFCGISIENARLYRASIELSMQLRSFMEISVSLSQPQTIKKLLEDIIKNTRKVIGAVTAALFMIEDNGISFEPFVLDEDIEVKLEVANKKKKEEEEDNLGVKRAIIARLMQGKSSGYDAEKEKQMEYRNKRIEHVISTKTPVFENIDETPEQSMMIVPIMSSDHAIMGAVMMQWKKNQSKFSYDDLKLLESYSIFLSVSLERSRLKTIAQLGSAEFEIQAWVSAEERKIFATPSKLAVAENEQQPIFSRDFSADLWNKGNNLIRVMFSIFDRFGLLQKFSIRADTFYHFLYDLRQSYNPVPYHNWVHAVDVTQYLSYELLVTGLDKVFTPFEILALLVASVCHDANHDGFTNQYNVKAQTPLGILFRNQSVMETHHCSVSIGILTKDQSNIFSSLSETELQQMWQLFISLILATDMAKHFQFVEAAQSLINSGRSWIGSADDRLLMMQLMIKLADISNVGRKFDIADKWVDILCEEFFRQGELEKANGMEYTSPLNDREHLDKAKSQIGFYKSICLPLYQILARINAGFAQMVAQVESNLSMWQKRETEHEKNSEKEAESAKIEAESQRSEETPKTE